MYKELKTNQRKAMNLMRAVADTERVTEALRETSLPSQAPTVRCPTAVLPAWRAQRCTWDGTVTGTTARSAVGGGARSLGHVLRGTHSPPLTVAQGD